ncbi:MAG: 7-cyano-7-deazaguanine reductase [Gammaproteobacteria bacterium]|jgi:7-cyano-7-deazaguanine reductase
MHSSTELPLGKHTEYVDRYSPSLLFPIKRKQARDAIGLAAGIPLPFFGVDLWTAYELTWLNRRGKPMAGVVQLEVACDSQCIVESKSMKQYLNSFAQSPFDNRDSVLNTLRTDLSNAFDGVLKINLLDVSSVDLGLNQAAGLCLDDLDIDIEHYDCEPSLLMCTGGAIKNETVHSDLFRSLCPVTGQPDFASVIVRYVGRAISHQSLLAYWVSFRNHQAFHESTVEQMFIDISARCTPSQLCVSGRFLRRGGIDINPMRSTSALAYSSSRLPRQ